MGYFGTYYHAYGFLGILGTLFWIWMLVDCIRNDPERGLWLWILILLNMIGALIYFFVRWLPGLNLPAPAFWARRQRADDVARAEENTRNIGNAKQFVELGDVYRQVGMNEEALEAYRQATEKDPEDGWAFWGAGDAALALGRHEEARDFLARLMELNFKHGRGEACMAMGETLLALGDAEGAASILERGREFWKYPRHLLLLARALQALGRVDEAREHLETVQREAKAAPAFYFRQHRRWIRQATRLARHLARNA